MPHVNNFDSLDQLCEQARHQFRGHNSRKQSEIDTVFTLCFDVLKSIGKFKAPGEWTDSKESWIVSVLIQSVETLLAMYYLSESGFWDNALALNRNFSELLVLAIAIGYDDQCFIDWKNGRSNFNSFDKIFKRATNSPKVPATEKLLLPHLHRYWIESSQIRSHNIRLDSIRTLVKEGQISFEPKVATPDFQEKRMNTIRNMLLDVVSLLLGIFDYYPVVAAKKSEFPEAPNIIARWGQCFQNQTWKNEQTA